MRQAVPGVIQIVRRANQRGGRMLSMLDLVDAGTLSRGQAAWLLARIGEGSSWLVGARPGGAGKTTIMGALLAMLPEATVIHLAASGSGWRRARGGECVVAYEIGPGDYEAYVWGDDLGELAALGERGCRIVSNLHADTLEEARDQLVRQNGVPPSAFDRFRLFLPIRLTGSRSRTVPTIPVIWRQVDAGWERVAEPRIGPSETGILAWLDEALDGEPRDIESVRASWLRWSERLGPRA